MSEENDDVQEPENQNDQEVDTKNNNEPDDFYKNTPVFDVSKDEFYRNIKADRNRMRFSNGSKVSNFMKSSKYRKPFYMRHTNKNGEPYLSRVK